MQERGGSCSRAAPRSLLAPSERLAGSAGDARSRERAGAECPKGIRLWVNGEPRQDVDMVYDSARLGEHLASR
jgi:hypothetical protein